MIKNKLIEDFLEFWMMKLLHLSSCKDKETNNKLSRVTLDPCSALKG